MRATARFEFYLLFSPQLLKPPLEVSRLLALSRDGDRIFLYEPDQGLGIPVMLQFASNSLYVGMPPVERLEHDYAVYDELDELIAAAGRGRGRLIRTAQRFSREYSKLFSDQIVAGELTIAQLRKLVSAHFARSAGDGAVHRDATLEVAMVDRALPVTG